MVSVIRRIIAKHIFTGLEVDCFGDSIIKHASVKPIDSWLRGVRSRLLTGIPTSSLRQSRFSLGYPIPHLQQPRPGRRLSKQTSLKLLIGQEEIHGSRSEPSSTGEFACRRRPGRTRCVWSSHSEKASRTDPHTDLLWKQAQDKREGRSKVSVKLVGAETRQTRKVDFPSDENMEEAGGSESRPDKHHQADEKQENKANRPNRQKNVIQRHTIFNSIKSPRESQVRPHH
ncbi:unnamed protein product [Protopolystoma xenopodis]|uniref:Uncharacterized protein n=1 Tax=Protopolystoma xenopodis TaxID=117903 RepID=A0A3S5FBQ0_9PLAT|nr:unnamed protein product [Protopolystoma xenopodis]